MFLLMNSVMTELYRQFHDTLSRPWKTKHQNIKTQNVSTDLKSVPPCGKLLPIIDPEDALVLVNPLRTGDGPVPVVRGPVHLLPQAENVPQECHKFKIIWLTPCGVWLVALNF